MVCLPFIFFPHSVGTVKGHFSGYIAWKLFYHVIYRRPFVNRFIKYAILSIINPNSLIKFHNSFATILCQKPVQINLKQAGGFMPIPLKMKYAHFSKQKSINKSIIQYSTAYAEYLSITYSTLLRLDNVRFNIPLICINLATT